MMSSLLRRHPVFTAAATFSLVLLLSVCAGRVAAWRLAKPLGVSRVALEVPADVDVDGDVPVRVQWVSINTDGVLQLGTAAFLHQRTFGFGDAHPGWSLNATVDSTGRRFGVVRSANGAHTLLLPSWLVALATAVLP